VTDNSGLALVCGGGGVWGIAWMTGLAAGLEDAGVDLRQASFLIGTSAGSVIATQLLGGLPTEELFERQTIAEKQPRELTPPPDCLATLMELTRREWNSPQERLQAICDLADTTDTVSVVQRRAAIADRLVPQADVWPETRLLLTAVDTATLDLVAFDAASGVSLTDAVAASCAVPGVWPPVPFGGTSYVDGGVWGTAENAHLAAGSRAVLILSPMGMALDGGPGLNPALAKDVARLEAEGASVLVITADEASLAAMAAGALDPATREPAANAGRKQGRQVAAEVGGLLESA
jgi:NTE family protein